MAASSSPPYRARKDTSSFLIEPVKPDAPTAYWEGHHATNPCSIRFSCDNRVFLGYRAGGTGDFYQLHQWKVWASHLGLAVLDERGEKVTARLPLPIMTIERDREGGVKLPQTREECDAFLKGPHAKRTLVLHDFRFTEYREYLYVVYHEGPLEDCFDCVVRMPVKDFLRRIERSIEIAKRPIEQIRDEWRKLWWADGVWQPCGVNGTNRIFPSKVTKGDIIYFELEDGSLQLCQRPVPFGTAVMNVGTKFYADATADGLTQYGVYETNTRPGFLDNSHLGNDGRPVRAMIGAKEVYIDVTHGCGRDWCGGRGGKPHIMYWAYLRVKDRRTGELLYWSEEPIIDYGRDWDRYAIEGAWVSVNPAIRGVMFAGGQETVVAGKNGLDDEWITYVGLGDTAIGTARFTLRQLLPQQVIEDIQRRESDLAKSVAGIEANEQKLPEKVNGWAWSIRNNPVTRTIQVVRKIEGETAERAINSRPGYFDAHGVVMGAMKYDNELKAWAVVYQGLRLCDGDGGKKTRVGYGLLLLWGENPEQVLYRSTEPIATREVPGWRVEDDGTAKALLEHWRTWLPESTARDIAYMNLDNAGPSSQMVKWQREKAGIKA